MRLLITRPRDDAETLAAALAARGVETMIEPMLEIVSLPGPRIARDEYQAILFTSANGVRALVNRNRGELGDLAAVPVFAVGDATARAARDVGFAQVESAAGDVGSLASLVVARLEPAAGPLLHIAASQLAGDLAGSLAAAGFTVRRSTLYEARQAQNLSPATIDALRHGAIDAVMFFSPRTAAAFVTLAQNAGVAPCLSAVAALCLSQAVAAAASAVSWRVIVVAPRPDQAALLGCLSDPTLQGAGAKSKGSIAASNGTPAARKAT